MTILLLFTTKYLASFGPILQNSCDFTMTNSTVLNTINKKSLIASSRNLNKIIT